jgi:hypothetical protein
MNGPVDARTLEMRLAEARRLDLWLAALHEHAHAVVARHFGVLGYVRLVPNPRGGLEEKYFGGSYHSIVKPRGFAKRMICLAGIVAELIETEPQIEPYEAFELLSDGYIEMSKMDADCAGSFTMKDVEESYRLVQSLWDEIRLEAMRSVRFTDV